LPSYPHRIELNLIIKKVMENFVISIKRAKCPLIYIEDIKKLPFSANPKFLIEKLRKISFSSTL
jgi:hypothetical protein